MAQTGSISTQKLVEILTGSEGLSLTIAAMSEQAAIELPQIDPEQVIAQNVAPEIAERATGAKYPAVHVYCDRIANALKEKFRTFSGTAHLVIEVRVSRDRLEGVERAVQLYVDAITKVLDTHRGDWGQGMFYSGTYEVAYSAVKHGGKNFIQTAKVTFELDIST